ncbi:hypothetical protein Tco_0104788 [Tanacetum coccineum]
MTMHEVVHEMVVGECHEPNSEGSGSAWKAYMNARVAGLFLLVLLEYPNGKGVVRATSRGLDMAPHWSGVGAAPLMSPRQDETSEPLLYAGWMAGPYRCKDATRGRNDDPVTSGVWNYVASQPKKRGTSKDVVASLDQRVAGVETSMAELKNQEEGLEGLDSDFTSMREDFRVALNTLSGDLKREIHGLRDSFMGRDPQVRKEFGDEVLHTTSTVGMENIERGTETIDTQAEIVAASKSNSIRRILRTRRRVGFINSSNLGRYGSISGTKTELERCGVQDLATTIAHAKALIDFSTRRETSKPKDRKVNQEKGRGEKNAQSKVDVARLKYQIFMT